MFYEENHRIDNKNVIHDLRRPYSSVAERWSCKPKILQDIHSRIVRKFDRELENVWPNLYLIWPPYLMVFLVFCFGLILRFGIESISVRFPYKRPKSKSTRRFFGGSENLFEESDILEYLDKQLEYASGSFKFQ
ncbi:unnamed protein product [Caenorhabditis angaria]|uniref:Uncharacterized protein n=1 Tax=Caenorhabditis angaria TaxID=860376 RepID=A0A9P1IPY0_9PELO|nr:unnamed protein product [Caenorhabditis angaria]